MGGEEQARRWVPALAAGAVLVAVIAAGAAGSGSSTASTPPTGTDAVTAPSDTPAGPAGDTTTTAPLPEVSAPATTKSQLGQTIKPGMTGSDIELVQARLKELHFDPGPVDGRYYTATRQAVWAFEALTTGKTYDQLKGIVTNDMWQLMQDDLVFKPRRETGPGTTHMEIYLPQQAAIVFTDDKPVLITHISSGELDKDGQPKRFHEVITIDVDENGKELDEPITKAITALSKTPGGVFQFSWRYPGKRKGPLGGMWNPVYFNQGIAVHGAEKVPVHPASHGCIRIPNFIADYFPSLVKRRDYVYVWGHDGREPEDYKGLEKQPSPNVDDPDATTTTDEPATTTKPTTTKPTSTTVKPTPTTTKPTPTTVKPTPTTKPTATTSPETVAPTPGTA